MPKNPMVQFLKQFSTRMNTHMFTGLKNGVDPNQISFIRQLQKELNESKLHTPLKQLEVVVIDFETTGFHPDNGDEILSIGAVQMNGPSIREEAYYTVVHPTSPVSETILQLTGLTIEELQNAPSLSEVLPSFYSFCKSRVFIAHHAKHEKQFLKKANQDTFKKTLEHRMLDTSFFIRIIDPSLSGQTLETCCQACEVNILKRHHALEDAKATAKVWQHIVKTAEQIGCETLEDLYKSV